MFRGARPVALTSDLAAWKRSVLEGWHVRASDPERKLTWWKRMARKRMTPRGYATYGGRRSWTSNTDVPRFTDDRSMIRLKIQCEIPGRIS